jgi:hypothetical protein
MMSWRRRYQWCRRLSPGGCKLTCVRLGGGIGSGEGFSRSLVYFIFCFFGQAEVEWKSEEGWCHVAGGFGKEIKSG